MELDLYRSRFGGKSLSLWDVLPGYRAQSSRMHLGCRCSIYNTYTDGDFYLDSHEYPDRYPDTHEHANCYRNRYCDIHKYANRYPDAHIHKYTYRYPDTHIHTYTYLHTDSSLHV